MGVKKWHLMAYLLVCKHGCVVSRDLAGEPQNIGPSACKHSIQTCKVS